MNLVTIFQVFRAGRRQQRPVALAIEDYFRRHRTAAPQYTQRNEGRGEKLPARSLFSPQGRTPLFKTLKFPNKLNLTSEEYGAGPTPNHLANPTSTVDSGRPS